VQVFKQQTGFFESALLAGHFNVDQHLFGREDGGETVHGNVGKLCTCRDRPQNDKKPPVGGLSVNRQRHMSRL
jgi:hypothetical protein